MPPRRQVRLRRCRRRPGEAVRVPQADGTLVVMPVGVDDELTPSLRTLSDVMATGHHAALGARVGPGETVAVVGDGAVGLCGVIAARRLGAERIIILGRHPDRIALAKEFGASDVVSERGDEAIERVRELTNGFGVHSALECVGYEQSTFTALSIARPGGATAGSNPAASSIGSGRSMTSLTATGRWTNAKRSRSSSSFEEGSKSRPAEPKLVRAARS